MSATIGLAVPDSTYAPVYLGVDKGLFEAAGLNPKLVTLRGGSDLVKAVAAGSVDIGVTGLAGVAQAIAQGQPLVVFYGGFNAPIFTWWARPPVDSVAGAKGKKWGVTRVGSSTDFLTRYLLEQNGLSPKTDVKIISGGAGAARLAAMKAGQLDVDIASQPWGAKYKALGYKLIARQSDLMKQYPDHVVFAKKSYVDDHPETVEAFLRGLVNGFKMTKNDRAAAEKAISKNVGISASDAKICYKSFFEYQFADGRIPSAKDMAIFWKIGVENGQFEKALPDSQWLDTKWIDSYPKWMSKS